MDSRSTAHATARGIAKPHFVASVDPNNTNKAFASHNRMLMYYAGCITIASPIKSYLELSKIALVGQNIVELLHVADEQRERLSIKYSIQRKDGSIFAKTKPTILETLHPKNLAMQK